MPAPTLKELTELVVEMSKQPDMQAVNNFSLSIVLTTVAHESYGKIPERTFQMLLGIAAALFSHAVESGEYQAAIDEFMQPTATRQ